MKTNARCAACGTFRRKNAFCRSSWSLLAHRRPLDFKNFTARSQTRFGVSDRGALGGPCPAILATGHLPLNLCRYRHPLGRFVSYSLADLASAVTSAVFRTETSQGTMARLSRWWL